MIPECGRGIYTAEIGDAVLTVDGQSAEISCYGRRIAVVPAKEPEQQTADAVIRWGSGDAPGDDCELRLLTAKTGNNRLLTAEKDGTLTVSALS